MTQQKKIKESVLAYGVMRHEGKKKKGRRKKRSRGGGA